MRPFGPTGKYPFGRLNAEDDGELQIGIAIDRRAGVVRIDFGTPTAWLALPSQHARELAAILTDKANELDKAKP